MNTKKIIFGSFILFGILLFSNLASAQLNLSDSLEFQRYQNIIKEFNNSDWVPIIVEVYTAEEVDDIVSSFSSTDFRNVERGGISYIFSVEVTQTGLDQLIDYPHIKAINLEESVNLVEDNQIINLSEEELITCTDSSDCIVVSLNCCNCEVSSINTPINELLKSINKNYQTFWNQNLEIQCSNIICASGINPEQIEKCNSYTSECKNNQCSLINKNEIIDKKNPYNFLFIVFFILFLLVVLIFLLLKKKKNGKKTK